MSTSFPAIEQLKRAIAIQERIEELQQELQGVLTGDGTKVVAKASASGDGRKGKRSAATRAKMAAAQKARWAAKQSGSEGAAPARKKRVLSEEARAKIAAAQKKRWAAAKAAK